MGIPHFKFVLSSGRVLVFLILLTAVILIFLKDLNVNLSQQLNPCS